MSEPTLYRLATETGLAANLAVLEGDRVLVLDRIEGFAFVKAAIEESHTTQGPGSASTLQEVRGRQEATKEYREASFELPVCTTALEEYFLLICLLTVLISFCATIRGRRNIHNRAVRKSCYRSSGKYANKGIA